MQFRHYHNWTSDGETAGEEEVSFRNFLEEFVSVIEDGIAEDPDLLEPECKGQLEAAFVLAYRLLVPNPHCPLLYKRTMAYLYVYLWELRCYFTDLSADIVIRQAA